MQSFYSPAKIITGDGCASVVGAEAVALGARRVLLVTDNVIRERTENVANALSSLRSAGTDVEVFAEVEHDPLVTTALRCTEFARAYRPDVIVGLGGGSSLDIAKATAIYLTNEDTPLGEMWGLENVPKPGLPSILLPTTGGTGSDSHTEVQPDYMPDRFESGTPNLPGIFGLYAALSELERKGLALRQSQEEALLKRFLNGLSAISGIRVIGTRDLSRKVGVISVDFTASKDNAEVADRLSNEFGILTRCGLHCAPNAHRTYGTFPQGTVRFSFNSSNTTEEIDLALQATQKIMA